MPPSFRESIRILPAPFWVLMGATFVTRFGVFVVPFLTWVMTKRGFSPLEAGWTVAAYSAGSFCASLVGGWVADRFGRNVTMAAAGLLGAVCMLLLSQAEQLHWLVLLTLLAGFVGEAGGPASVALVQDIVPPEHRLAAYAVQRFVVNLAWAFGPAVAGFVVERSIFWLFAGDAISSGIFGVVALFFLPRGKRSCRHTSGWSHALASIRVNRPFLVLFISCVAVAFMFRQTNTTFTLHFEKSGNPASVLGWVLAINGVMICLMEMPLASYTRWMPVRNAIAVGYVGMALSFIVFLFGNSVTAFTVCMVIFTAGEMMAFSRQQAYAASLSPEDMRGRYSGFLGLAWSIGNITASVGAMALYQWSPNAVWVVTATVGVLAALVLVRASVARNAGTATTSVDKAPKSPVQAEEAVPR
ncbi:putative MFS family arabinose efflux permease [Roseimicrobium gellanilyticum]|uniref:Putative MFS family arabinose efflux permease n=1 Tax=Roseimicrobium gellanilyticum TaxID=748857 RepID=A0A366HLD9_9BACT|nr:MFS transporter [Roseimicrobium gellanilyticum]RBP43743.1 putative MFS family arabinose efflux permease [Roseimicrobium gellanilyticum]